MEIREFAQKVQQKIMKRLGGDASVDLIEVEKNNQVKLLGLSILPKGCNISPTIYLNSFWEAYEEGATMAMVVEKIMQVYGEDTPRQNIDMSFFKDFEKVKDRICYRIINCDKNKELFEKIPHIDYLDLAICFFYSYQGEELGKGSILINNSHAEMWGTNAEELFALAQCNSPQLFPWECHSMESMIETLMCMEQGEEGAVQEPAGQLLADVPMQILTNVDKFHGAACILYPGVLEEIAGRLSANLYILPSSVHEVILIPDTGCLQGEHLKEMISEVNGTRVEPEEILADSLYYFDRTEKKVRII